MGCSECGCEALDAVAGEGFGVGDVEVGKSAVDVGADFLAGFGRAEDADYGDVRAEVTVAAALGLFGGRSFGDDVGAPERWVERAWGVLVVVEAVQAHAEDVWRSGWSWVSHGRGRVGLWSLLDGH